MSPNFDLVITADTPSLTAELRLLDGDGNQLAYRLTDFKTIAVSRRQGLFDLRNYLKNYVEQGKEAASVAEIGVCIAEEVLGQEIFLKLWQANNQRTLRIQLPGATEEENHLAAALARVPWEIARPAVDKPTLADRHLLVRVVHDMAAPATQPLALGPDEPLRVLFVFAEARGSRPLAARRERRELLRLFEKEIYPKRRVVAHFLTHGVTRERLEAQIQENGGYHIVHWSGHGHLNLLELAKAGGGSDRLSGQELLDLCGGFIPRLFFLSACHSGDILRVKDWKDFLAVAQGQEPGTKQVPDPATKDVPLNEQPGYTGTAHALLQGGVPSVVAMRYAVGDEYARELGLEFYRALLAHDQPKNAAAALTMARQSLRDPKKPRFARFAACDHATPVLYGAEQPGLTLPKGRSPALEPRNPRLHAIAELTTAGHEHFVGRTWELAGLGADFIGSSGGAEVKPVAVITGLGGMGKTALTAEALALWESRFEWVLLYQAKPNALGFDATLRDIHMKLNAELGRYHEHVKAHPADAIHRAADGDFTGPGAAGSPHAQPHPRPERRADPACAGQLRDQPQAAGRTRHDCRAALGLPGPGLGPLPRPARDGAGRHALAGADHLPPAPRRPGGDGEPSRCGSARCRRARRRSTCGSTRAWARWSSAAMRRKRPSPCGCWTPAASTRCSWTASPGWQPAARRCDLN